MPAGRPTKYTDKKIAEITSSLLDYIQNEKIPILAEFAYTSETYREKLYELANKNDGLKYAIKRCKEKKEAQLEKLALLGAIDKTMAIFSLKQLGWRDKQEIEHSGKLGVTINRNTKRKKNGNKS